MKYQTFTVKTNFSFPLDMLRYDYCFPKSSKDALEIEKSLTEHTLEEREIELARFVRIKSTSPTVGRWNSFQCNISNVETR